MSENVIDQLSILAEAARRVKDRFPNLRIMNLNPQILALHTIVRDQKTGDEEFVFYADRLIRLLIEEALETVQYSEKIIYSPSGEAYTGCALSGDVCGVAMIRSGEAFETALRAVAGDDVQIGKILVDSTASSENGVLYCKLPENIASPDLRVLLLDAVTATGQSIVLAIARLLTAGVAVENITLVNLICSIDGLALVFSRYPQIRIFTSFCDAAVEAHSHQCLPGIGDFADRYFATQSKKTVRG